MHHIENIFVSTGSVKDGIHKLLSVDLAVIKLSFLSLQILVRVIGGISHRLYYRIADPFNSSFNLKPV